MRFLAILACAVVLTGLGAKPGHAEKRVALIIGNGSYSSAPRLPNPRNDAGDVASTLKRNGFETIVGLDLDLEKENEKLRLAIKAFSAPCLGSA
jgi:Caspase domain